MRERRARPTSNTRLGAAIFRAQIVDLLRDRRALFAAFVLPLLLVPALFVGRATLARFAERARQSSTVRAAVDLSRVPEAARARVRAAIEACAPVLVEDVDATRVVEASADAGRERAAEMLSAGADALVIALPGERATSWSIRTYYDGTRDAGNEAQSRVVSSALALSDAIADERRLALLGHDRARGITLSPIDVAEHADDDGESIGRWLPLLAVFVLLGGASHAALAAFAGERESGTLETLLVHPVPSLVVVAAKYAAVLAVGVAALALNAASVVACLAAGADALGGPRDSGLALDAARVAAAGLAFVPAAVLVCALLCAACGRARTFREGQSLLLPLLLLTIVPTLPALQPDLRLDALLASVPLTGPSLLLRDVLRGTASTPLAIWTVLASASWAALALSYLARTLDAERLLQHATNEAEADERRLRSRDALRAGLVVVFAVYLLGGWMQSLHAAWGLAATLWIVLPVAAYALARATARRSRTSVADVVQWRAPRVAHVVAALCAAPAAAWFARRVLAWQEHVLPLPSTIEHASLPSEIAALSTTAQIALLALSPAICEELFFRGAFLGALRRDLRWPAVLAWQALCFGAVHASIHRFAPTAALGVVLAAFALRTRSLVPSIVLHAGANAVVVLGDRHAALADPRLAWLGLAAIVLVVAVPGRVPGSGPDAARALPTT